eukprot:4873084-Amphidinium_carterae.1
MGELEVSRVGNRNPCQNTLATQTVSTATAHQTVEQLEDLQTVKAASETASLTQEDEQPEEASSHPGGRADYPTIPSQAATKETFGAETRQTCHTPTSPSSVGFHPTFANREPPCESS